MYSNNLDAPAKLGKARANLLIDDCFFGSLSLRLHVQEFTKEQIAYFTATMGKCTAATDGIHFFFNPAYIEELSLSKTGALFAHEVAHVALGHHLRRDNRDPELWNIACDYAINLILKDAGYDISENWLLDTQYENMSAERIYRRLYEEAQKNASNTCQESGEGDQASAAGQGTGDPTQDGLRGPAQPAKPTQGTPQGTTQGGMQGTQGGEENQGQKGNIKGSEKQVIDGMVLDIPIDKADIDELRKHEEGLTIAIEHAAKQARAAGDLPGSLEYLVKAQKEHKIQWQDVLYEFMIQTTVKDDYSFSRVNRRYQLDDFFLPGYENAFEQPNVVICDDASGSHIDRQSQQAVANEMSGILEEFNATFTVIYFDVKVTDTKELETEDLPITLKPRGGGGTRFLPVFEYIKKKKIEAEAIVFFTDLAAFDWPEVRAIGDPGIPVLWLNTYRENDDFDVPFGIIVPLELN